MGYRVVIVGIYHESNTFLPEKTKLADFEAGHLFFGEDIRKEYAQAHHELGGMLEVLDRSDVETVPLMFAEATPSGTITAEAYEKLLQLMMDRLRQTGNFDGILVAAHGAAVCESFPDMDGHWLQILRLFAGKKKPIIATLDPHANVTRQMADATDAMVAYKTNPHLDQRDTGKVAARLMVDTLAGKIRPVQFLTRPPVSISIEQQHTGSSPCKELYALAASLTAHTPFLSVSIFLGFPYADVKEMGSAFIVITDNTPTKAAEVANRLGEYLLAHKAKFVGEKIGVEAALKQTINAKKPVLLLDMGDNVGGGSPGDSTFLVEALERRPGLRAFICLYDPASVRKAEQTGEGNVVKLDIGGKTDSLHGRPFSSKVRIEQIAEGVFKETQPRHGGQVNFSMGIIAIVTTENGNTIMLTSKRVAPFSLSQLTTFNIDPSYYDVLVAKGVHAPLGAYNQVCETIIRVNTPGITQADVTALPFKHRRRPLYPFEKNIVYHGGIIK